VAPKCGTWACASQILEQSRYGREGGRGEGAPLPGPVACLPLLDGVEFRCDRNGLLLGLRLAPPRHAAGLRALTYPRREPSPSETRPRDGHNWDPDVDLGSWAASGGFLMVQVGARGELVELTNANLGLWDVLFGFDYLFHR
jgi:hypothetical protein